MQVGALSKNTGGFIGIAFKQIFMDLSNNNFSKIYLHT